MKPCLKHRVEETSRRTQCGGSRCFTTRLVAARAGNGSAVGTEAPSMGGGQLGSRAHPSPAACVQPAHTQRAGLPPSALAETSGHAVDVGFLAQSQPQWECSHQRHCPMPQTRASPPGLEVRHPARPGLRHTKLVASTPRRFQAFVHPINSCTDGEMERRVGDTESSPE